MPFQPSHKASADTAGLASLRRRPGGYGAQDGGQAMRLSYEAT